MSVALYKPYCSLLELQKECRNIDTVQEDWFRQCINMASRGVEGFTRTDFWYHDHATSPLSVRRSQVFGDGIFLLWPVITLTSVTENGETVPVDEYYFDAGSSKIQRLSVASALGILGADVARDPKWVLPGGGNTLTLTGTFGYVLDDVNATDVPPNNLPALLRRACVLIAAEWTRKSQREVVTVGGTVAPLPFGETPKDVQSYLGMHRNIYL